MFGYSALFTSDSFRDGQGNEIPGLEVELAAFAPRFVHTWEERWNGFSLSSGLVFQMLSAELTVGGNTETAAGPALFGLEPLHLQRSFGAWHFVTGPIIYIAMGKYDPAEPVNQTLNYDSYAFQGNTTWTPTPDWDFSLNLALELKEENRDTDYKSGDTFSATFGIGYRPFADKRWDFGITGYYVDQFEDDKLNGRTVGDGVQVKKLAFGPKLVFRPNPAVAVVLQWHRESEVENAPQGDIIWLEWLIPLFAPRP